jgi:hypothetical protein
MFACVPSRHDNLGSFSHQAHAEGESILEGSEVYLESLNAGIAQYISAAGVVPADGVDETKGDSEAVLSSQPMAWIPAVYSPPQVPSSHNSASFCHGL